jgi:hypothetical protein
VRRHGAAREEGLEGNLAICAFFIATAFDLDDDVFHLNKASFSPSSHLDDATQ